MKKIVVSIIVAVTVLLALSVFFPHRNRGVKMREMNYGALFNDLNGVQLRAARQLGIAPLKDREEAEEVKKGLVRIGSNRHYTVAPLTHSIPYLTEGAAQLLDEIGENFQDSLESKGLNPNRIIVTSVLRTQEDVRKLQKSGNPNSVTNSAHCHATTFDIAYAHYDRAWFKNFRYCEPVEAETLKQVLGEVLRDLRRQKRCYVKYEAKQRCFHITTRKG